MFKFSQKIKDADNLAPLTRQFKKSGKKVILAHGAFDLFHHGHLHYLANARKLGDILIVSVVSDDFVRKGLKRPVFQEMVRANSIALLDCVDYVVFCNDFGPWEIIKKLRPDVYVKGYESRQQLGNPLSGVNQDKKAIESAGGKLVFTHTPSIHSIETLNRYFSITPEGAAAFISDFKKKYNSSDVLINLEKLENMRVLVVGETIIDEYRYVSPLGKPAKAHVVTTHYNSKELFAGGAAACANHVASLCHNVELVTVLSSVNSKADFLRRRLKPNIKLTAFYSPQRKTIIKRRFLDGVSYAKFFEEYEFDKEPISRNVSDGIKKYLLKKINDFDLVLVADYGHGFLSSDLIRLLTSKARFLAVTSQTNSGNAGFNYITKYAKADFVSVDEIEARLATQDDVSEIETILAKLFKLISPKQLVITLGGRGLITSDRGGKITRVPAFVNRITDTVGAGDALLCFSAPCSAAGFDAKTVSFVGSVAAAIAVNVVGNRNSVDRDELFKHIGYLME